MPIPSMIIKISTVMVLALFLHGQPGAAAEIGGVNIVDNLDIDGKTFGLAGSGLRKKLFIKVYAAGFYLDKPADLDGLISSDQEKAVLMHFIYRRVTAAKLNKAWREGFSENTPEAGPDLKKRMDDFIALFKDDVVKDDRILLSYNPGQGTTIIFNDQKLGTISGHDFNRALMKIWFGENPADQGLKESVAAALEK